MHWEDQWIKTAETLVRDEYARSYASNDHDAGMEEVEPEMQPGTTENTKVRALIVFILVSTSPMF